MPSMWSLTLHPLYSVCQSPESCRWRLCANTGSTPAISHPVEHWGHKIHLNSPRYSKSKRSPKEEVSCMLLQGRRRTRCWEGQETSWKPALPAGASPWHLGSVKLLPSPPQSGILRRGTLDPWSLVNWPICEQWLWLESTAVTCELPCQCANTGCLNDQKKSSKHQTFQPRVRFLSAVLPASVGGSWKRMCKQCSSKSLTCLEVVCCALADSTSHVLSQTLTMYKVHDPCSSHPAGDSHEGWRAADCYGCLSVQSSSAEGCWCEMGL